MNALLIASLMAATAVAQPKKQPKPPVVYDGTVITVNQMLDLDYKQLHAYIESIHATNEVLQAKVDWMIRRENCRVRTLDELKRIYFEHLCAGNTSPGDVPSYFAREYYRFKNSDRNPYRRFFNASKTGD